MITWVSLMTFPRYGVHLDFTEFFGRECAIFTTLPASQVERLSVSKLSSTFAECWKMLMTNKLENRQVVVFVCKHNWKKLVGLPLCELEGNRENSISLHGPEKRLLTIDNSIVFTKIAGESEILSSPCSKSRLDSWRESWLGIKASSWNDLFCSGVDDLSIWWQMFSYVFLSLKRWFQFNCRIDRTHFSSAMTLNNCKRIAEIRKYRKYIFRWRSRYRRRRVCLIKLPIATINGQNRSNSYTIRSFEEATIPFELHSQIVSSRS